MAPIDVNSLLKSNGEPEDITAIKNQLALIINSNINYEPKPGHLEAEAVAGTIDELYASGYASDDKAETLFWTLWGFYLDVAKLVPADDDARQQFLVDTVDRLRVKERGTVKVWREDTRVWRDLTMLGPNLREAWNYSPQFDNSEKDKAGIQGWINLNSFVARGLGAEIAQWDNFAIWTLRDVLETPSQNDIDRDTQIRVAYEWVAHAGKYLRKKSQGPRKLDEATERSQQPGELLKGGESGLNAKRWDFWKERLETLAGEAKSEEAKAKAQKAVEIMKSA